jgi:XTP/dITP diphosphohydrolase
MTDIVYATTNPGKFTEVSKLFAGHGITIKSAADYKVDIDVPETGTTLETNAILKAVAYRNTIKEDVIIVSDDTGLEIDALGGEPGIKVRRWKGYKMSDDEIISYALERLKDVPEDKRTAQFRTVIAIAKKGLDTKVFTGILPGRIVTEPHAYREEGLPFQPLFYATDYNLMIYKIHQMTNEEKFAKHIMTHRERAVTAALPYLATLTK